MRKRSAVLFGPRSENERSITNCETLRAQTTFYTNQFLQTNCCTSSALHRPIFTQTSRTNVFSFCKPFPQPPFTPSSAVALQTTSEGRLNEEGCSIQKRMEVPVSGGDPRRLTRRALDEFSAVTQNSPNNSQTRVSSNLPKISSLCHSVY